MDTTTILNQLQHLLPLSAFSSFVRQHEADRYVKRFSCKDQLTTLLYAQATGKDSLREIETGLRMWDSKWYHLGLESVSRSTLARANENRPYQIYESLFYTLLEKCRSLSPETARFRFDNPLYALDATTVDLCLALFPWARFHHEKGAIKLHTLFNVRSQIPEFITLTDGTGSDVEQLQHLDLKRMPKASILVADRAYVDYSELYRIHTSERFFVMRLKKGAQIFSLEQLPVTEEGVLKDERICFVLPQAQEDYPDDLRLVTYYDEETEKTFRFLTNSDELSAKTIADIYKARWQIELFFKWIKQNLRVKSFFGLSENAVKTQIWIAISVYLMVAILNKTLRIEQSMSRILQVISVNIFSKDSIHQLLMKNDTRNSSIDNPNPLMFNDF